jgi:Tfp pilus assembly protein PilN
MLQTNLATRPFYNVRAVRGAIGVAAALVLALVITDVVLLIRLTAAQRALGARAVEAEGQARLLLAEADTNRRQIDPVELDTVATAAREANLIIDRRAFSWTALFEHFESTLPTDVRITAVQPTVVGDGSVRVTVAVQARRAEDLDAFVEALEASGTFHGALTTQEATDADGLLNASITATYAASPPSDAVSAQAEERVGAVR